MGGRDVAVDAVAVESVSMLVTAMIDLVTPAEASIGQDSSTWHTRKDAPSRILHSQACVIQLPRIDSEVPNPKVPNGVALVSTIATAQEIH